MNENAGDRMRERIPADWSAAVTDALTQPFWTDLEGRVAQERRQHPGAVFPPEPHVFRALELTPLEQVKAVILGQDPYIRPGQAHGLAFSVPPGVTPLPPSLRKIRKELDDDIPDSDALPAHGDLSGWATQGVLLLNTTLTVRAGRSDSHGSWGWSRFTDAVIRVVSEHRSDVVFLLWGLQAHRKSELIDPARHPAAILSGHPMARASAKMQFVGSKPFSRANAALEPATIDWRALSPRPDGGAVESGG